MVRPPEPWLVALSLGSGASVAPPVRAGLLRAVVGSVRGRSTAATTANTTPRTPTVQIVVELVRLIPRKRLTSVKHGTACASTHPSEVAQ